MERGNVTSGRCSQLQDNEANNKAAQCHKGIALSLSCEHDSSNLSWVKVAQSFHNCLFGVMLH